MSKIDLVPITGAQNLSAINDNFQKVSDALNDRVLYRDNPVGEPNQVKTDVDMDNNRIYNLPQPQEPSEPVRLQDLGDVTALTEEAKGYAERAEAAGAAALDSANTSTAAAQAATLNAAQADASANTATIKAGEASVDADRAEAAAASAENKVPQTSGTGAAVIPAGTELDRPDPSIYSGKLLVRGNTDTGKPEWYDWNDDSWKEIGSGGSGGLFEFGIHNGPRNTIPAGFYAYDGQVIQHADNPKVCEAIWAGQQHAVDDAQWAANKNKWSRGDGSTWVRAPDLNDAAGTDRAFYLRGSPESLNGSWLNDAMQGHFHQSYKGSESSGVSFTTGGVLPRDTSGIALTKTTFLNFANEPISDGIHGLPRVADETRVKTANIVYIFRAFSEVENAGAIDAAQLATQLAAVDAAVQTLDESIDFTIIYPNGGTEAAPANASINSRYVTANPFPNHPVICQAEIRVGGKWGITSWMAGTSSAAGVLASEFDGSIVIQTGGGGLTREGGWSGQPNPAVTGLLTTPSPFRVKVWKVKGSTS